MPRSQGFQDRFQSCLSIHGRPTGITSAGRRRRCAATHSASPTAKIATAITTMSMPSASSGMPKVARGCPVSESMPTIPIASPNSSEISPRIFDEPSTAVTATKANNMIAR